MWVRILVTNWLADVTVCHMSTRRMGVQMDGYDVLVLIGVLLILVAVYLVFGWSGALGLAGAGLVGVGIWGASKGGK